MPIVAGIFPMELQNFGISWGQVAILSFNFAEVIFNISTDKRLGQGMSCKCRTGRGSRQHLNSIYLLANVSEKISKFK
jgi:hypothetical protein